jgi:DNA-binding transcriptional MerR regulator
VLRYWEDQFPMLRPVKRSGGRRYYRPEDVALLVDINRLVHAQGYTLRGARQYLEERSVQVRREPSVPAPVAMPVIAPPLQGQLALAMPQDDLLDALIGLRGSGAVARGRVSREERNNARVLHPRAPVNVCVAHRVRPWIKVAAPQAIVSPGSAVVFMASLPAAL